MNRPVLADNVAVVRLLAINDPPVAVPYVSPVIVAAFALIVATDNNVAVAVPATKVPYDAVPPVVVDVVSVEMDATDAVRRPIPVVPDEMVVAVTMSAARLIVAVMVLATIVRVARLMVEIPFATAKSPAVAVPIESTLADRLLIVATLKLAERAATDNNVAVPIDSVAADSPPTVAVPTDMVVNAPVVALTPPARTWPTDNKLVDAAVALRVPTESVPMDAAVVWINVPTVRTDMVPLTAVRLVAARPPVDITVVDSPPVARS